MTAVPAAVPPVEAPEVMVPFVSVGALSFMNDLSSLIVKHKDTLASGNTMSDSTFGTIFRESNSHLLNCVIAAEVTRIFETTPHIRVDAETVTVHTKHCEMKLNMSTLGWNVYLNNRILASIVAIENDIVSDPTVQRAMLSINAASNERSNDLLNYAELRIEFVQAISDATLHQFALVDIEIDNAQEAADAPTPPTPPVDPPLQAIDASGSEVTIDPNTGDVGRAPNAGSPAATLNDAIDEMLDLPELDDDEDDEL